jgi:hypothetical protein
MVMENYLSRAMILQNSLGSSKKVDNLTKFRVVRSRAKVWKGLKKTLLKLREFLMMAKRYPFRVGAMHHEIQSPRKVKTLLAGQFFSS